MIEQRNVIVARSRGVASPTRLPPNYPSTSPSASLLKKKKKYKSQKRHLATTSTTVIASTDCGLHTDICLELHKGFIACRLHEGLTACRHDPWVNKGHLDYTFLHGWHANWCLKNQRGLNRRRPSSSRVINRTASTADRRRDSSRGDKIVRPVAAGIATLLR